AMVRTMGRAPRLAAGGVNRRTSSADLLNLRLRLLQPVRHVHFAIHRRRGGEVLLGLLALAGAPVELAEAEVAVGDERAYAELVGERQRLSVVPGCVFAASGRRDVSDEAEGVGLVSPSPQSAGECQRLAGVAVGLVDPPSPKGGFPRAQKDERRPVVPEATGVLEGARGQRERLVSTAGESVGDAESRGDDRFPNNDLPGAGEVKVPLEGPGRTHGVWGTASVGSRRPRHRRLRAGIRLTP